MNGISAKGYRRSGAALALGALVMLPEACRSFDATSTPPGEETSGENDAGSGGQAPTFGSGGDGGNADDAGNGGGPLAGGSKGESGSAGVGGSQGGASGSGLGGGGAGTDGGSSGDGGDGGDGGASEVIDVIVVPWCVDQNGYVPPLKQPGAASDIAISRSSGGSVPVVYATQPGHQVTAVRWQNGLDPAAEWVGWGCFGVVPAIDRITATILGNLHSAVIASSSDGRLWMRFAFPSPEWGQWMPMTPPSGEGPIADVDIVAAESEMNRLYAARSGHVFTRHATSTEPYAAFGSWREIGDFDVRAIAACRVDVHRDHVFIATDQGRVYSKEIDVEAPSDEGWVELPGAFSDISALDCLDDAAGDLRLYLGDPSGAIRLSFAPFEAANNVTTHTQRVEAIDVLEIANSDDHLLTVVDASGNAWRFRNATGWQL